MSQKRYYIQEVHGVDEFCQLVETPASKERTEKHRFVITTVTCIVSAVAAVIAAIASVLALVLR